MNDEPNPLDSLSRRDALDRGMTDAQLRSVRFTKPFHGIRAVVAPATHLESAIVYLPRMKPWQFYTSLTGAAIWGAPLRRPLRAEDPLGVGAMAPRRSPRTRGVIGFDLQEGSVEVVDRGLFTVTDPASTLVQLAKVVGQKDLLAIADYLVAEPRNPSRLDPRPFCTIDDLVDRAERARSRGVARLMEILPLVSTASASRPESILRLLLHDGGLPDCGVNVDIYDRRGRWIAIGDLVYPDYKVLVEYDGWQHTTSAAQRERDRERLNDLALEGWIVIRVHYDGLERGRFVTVERVRAALLLRGWRG